MASLDFPTSPTTGQVYTAAGKTWRWNGTGWAMMTGSSNGPPPTVQTFLSGSGTYTKPAGVLWIDVTLVGGGAGGGGGGGGGTGTAGGNTTFGSLTAGGGQINAYQLSGTPGTATGGSVFNLAGAYGQAGVQSPGSQGQAGGVGGHSILGGAGAGNWTMSGTGASANTGSGGGGGGAAAIVNALGGTGGSSGGAVRHIQSSPAATYSYSVGVGGAGGAAGASGFAAGAGAAGIIIVTEYYGGGGGASSNSVSSSGAPTAGQFAFWTDATHIQGRTGIPGVTNGSNAAAGDVGEEIEGGPTGTTSITVGVWTSMQVIVLSPGDWDVQGVMTIPAAGLTGAGACIATPAETPDTDLRRMRWVVLPSDTSGFGFHTVEVNCRISTASSGSWFLTGNVTPISVSGVSSYLRARRRR